MAQRSEGGVPLGTISKELLRKEQSRGHRNILRSKHLFPFGTHFCICKILKTRLVSHIRPQKVFKVILKNCTVKMKNYRKYYYYKIHEQGS
jgi:hypothetical protein